jgi:hypothetical protein
MPRYDADRDPVPWLNDPARLDTPIGVLRVFIEEGHRVAWLMHPDDPDEGLFPVLVLEPGQHPSDAVYGRRWHERDACFAASNALTAARKELAAATLQARAEDTRRALEQFAREHHHDAAEVIATARGAA